ncbi:hypothetical protein Hypma_006620 [Hypsizygus marmoreus]|uniref:Uncharacterized protein n=1 Tax=Hypsizygus marmoreus TaxID=39966 RepID=A0A369JZ86_HYPMA|nr:hypothetical protein Hypma_006620 [Hypsizygus marmoreus]
MASNPGAPQSLAERADIHKSCKSLETLLNVLNDYCEAMGATVLLQKKLARALHETAGMKTTNEIAANAMNASAAIFEASSDIDSKFAKVADKEYDAISAEVKKWFKKLAKEEKAHDERMFNANAKIKQAGQVYEKKSKKSPRDATEEHARYINLISALGPEISQEKYNHALNITQRHITTTYSTAACLSRIADAEWLRTCEGVRRFSPTIGQLGEWRALCEGGWSGPIPQDLPDVEETQQSQPDRDGPITSENRPETEDRQAPTTLRNVEARNSRESTEQSRAPPGYSSATEAAQSQHYSVSTRNSPTLSRVNHTTASPNGPERNVSTAPLSYDPLRLYTDKNNTDSVRSLSAFPLPPTHFPIPPLRQQQPSQSQSSQSSAHANSPNMPRLTESPLPGGEDEDAHPDPSASPQYQNVPSPITAQPSQEQKFQVKHTVTNSDKGSASLSIVEEEAIRQPIPVRSQTALPTSSSYPRDMHTPGPVEMNPQTTRGDYDDEREFGINTNYTSKAPTVEGIKSSGVERNDTGESSGSIVAAMRNRYSSTSGTTSPPPRDLPRLPLSVNNLASRYEPGEGSSSPRILKTPSTSMSRHLPLTPIVTGAQVPHPNASQDHVTSGDNQTGPLGGTLSPKEEEAARRRQQRINDLAQLELKEKELELRERERDIEMRARELDRDRARLMHVPEGEEYTGQTSKASRDVVTPQPQTQLRPRERRTSFRKQRPQSQLEPGNTSPHPVSGGQSLARPQSQYSYSTSHLVPPSPSAQASYSHDGQSPHYSHSQYSPSASSSQQSTQAAHAPYCGCETCSAAKYKEYQSSPPADHRPPAQPITLRPAEKSKTGWMRRLSMPVGNAFHLDSKKGIGNIAVVGSGGGQGKSGFFTMDGKKNASSTALRSGIQEDGRRSYEASGVTNRSMTNLGNGRR